MTVAAVFRGWLGDRNTHDGFQWGERHWQADEDQPYGVNPLGSLKLDSEGVEQDIDGVLPDDQRRGSGPAGAAATVDAGPPPVLVGGGGPMSFVWPPAKTRFVYEALQAATLSAVIIHRAGLQGWGNALFDPWAAGDEALSRAMAWLEDPDRGNFPVDDAEASVGDAWIPHVLNSVYGTAYTAPVTGVGAGKAFGFADYFVLNESWPDFGTGGGGE